MWILTSVISIYCIYSTYILIKRYVNYKYLISTKIIIHNKFCLQEINTFIQQKKKHTIDK